MRLNKRSSNSVQCSNMLLSTFWYCSRLKKLKKATTMAVSSKRTREQRRHRLKSAHCYCVFNQIVLNTCFWCWKMVLVFTLSTVSPDLDLSVSLQGNQSLTSCLAFQRDQFLESTCFRTPSLIISGRYSHSLAHNTCFSTL